MTTERVPDAATRSYKALVIALLAASYAASLYVIANPFRAARLASHETASAATAVREPSTAVARSVTVKPAETARPRTTRVRTRSS